MREELSTELKAELTNFAVNPCAAGLVWEDETSYSKYGERIPTVFAATVGPATVTIIRGHIQYPGQWVFQCPELGFRNSRLPAATTPEEAAQHAVSRCIDKALWLAHSFNNIQPQGANQTG